MKQKFYSFEKNTDNSAELYIYGDIVSYEWDESDVSAFGFKKELDALGEISEINVHINSCGGDTFQGLTIYNLLKQLKATVNVYIDGMAASAASIIAMAGNKIYMPKTSLIMIHNCWTWTVGNSKELRKTADDMDKIKVAYKEAYLSKVKITEDKLDKLLDEETYMTADECLEMGFADEIIPLTESRTINQHASRCILNLVNRLKKQDADLSQESTTINEETTNIIAEKIVEKIMQKIETKDKKGTKNNENQDTLVVSFLNKFLK